MQTPHQIVNEAWNAGMKPPPVLTVSEWADQFRIVAQPSPAPGPWRTERTPYLRQVMDCLSPMSAARTIAVEKGSQLGATEAGLNWLGYKMHQYPSSFLVVLPSQGVAEEWSKTRLSGMVENSPELAGLLAPQKSRDSGNTIFNKKVRGGKGLIKFAWSSSGAKLRSTPAADLILDEVDGFDGDVEGEGDPVTGLKRRFTNFPRGKMLMISTPTGASTSRIHREFLAGDRRYYFMPCPHCGHYQRFIFTNLKWAKPIDGETPNERDARYAAAGLLCAGCSVLIAERFKGQMLARGVFVATVTCTGGEGQRPKIEDAGFPAAALPGMAAIFAEMETARWVSFHLPAGLSPLGWYSWSTMASDWEAVKGKRDVNALKVFVNQVLGEVWEDERGDAPDDEKIWARREYYPHFSTGAGAFPWNPEARVPHRGLFLTAAVDLQQNPSRIEVGVKAWGRGKEAWHIGYWVFRGDISRVENEPWQMLAELLAMDFPHAATGQPLPIMAMAIDTGYLANVVYEFALNHPTPNHSDATGSSVTHNRTVIPTAGDSDWQKIVASVSKTDAARRRQNVRIWKVGGVCAKNELYGWLRLPIPESDSTPSPGFQHYPDYQRAWFAGLCSEQRIVRKGRASYEIIPGHERNEPLDIEQYNRLAIAVCGIDNPTMFTEKYWQDMEAHCHVLSPAAVEHSVAKPTEKRKDDFIPKRKWF